MKISTSILFLCLFGSAVAFLDKDITMKTLSKQKTNFGEGSMIMEQFYKQFKSFNFKKILDKIDIEKLPFNISNECVKDYKGLNNKNIFSYLDAFGKPGAGIALGNGRWFGSYKECMAIQGAHYCSYGKIFITSFKQFLTLGMCVPETCGVNDITAVLKYAIQYLPKNGNVAPVYILDNPAYQGGPDSACYNKKKSFSNGAIVMMFISSLIGFLCLMGTITDRVCHYIKICRSSSYVVYVNEDVVINEKEEMSKEEENNTTSMHTVKEESEGIFLVKFLMCFSLIKNTRAIFDTTIPAGAITSVNGIRTLSIMWVILGHTISFGMSVLSNTLTLFKWMDRFTMQGILNATVSVDSFFFLSGLLVSYLTLKRLQTDKLVPLISRYYIHRYIRLTPSYAYLIFFYACIFPYLADGPTWFTQGPHSLAAENCDKYWWSNLLYINNLTNLKKMCFGWSWYLANDMQFYVISPIILWCMYKFKWIGVVAANGVFLLACFIANGVLIDHHNASPIFYEPNANNNMMNTGSPTSRYMMYIYMKPWTRMSPYLVGLVLGYILRNKHVVAKIKNLFYSIGWLLAIAFGLLVVYGPYTATVYQWKEVDHIIFGVMFRFVWALALAWVVYACHNGYGGLVNDLMSWRAFIPLSRLTYATYLIHPMVIYLFYFTTQVGIVMTDISLAYSFVSITTLSFTAAYVVAVCIEYPVFNLEKLLSKF